MRVSENDPLVRHASFGREVELFLQSDIGDFLLKRAEEEIADAVTALKTVAPWRRRRIQQLQNTIAVAERFQLWLADAVADGHTAMQTLEEESADG
jgi:hypothetical protein